MGLYYFIGNIPKEAHMAEQKKVATQNSSGGNTKKTEQQKKTAELLPCNKPHVAEASRNQEEDEACDDGVH